MSSCHLYNTADADWKKYYREELPVIPSGDIYTQLPAKIARIRAVASIVLGFLGGVLVKATSLKMACILTGLGFAAWTVHKHLRSFDPLLASFGEKPKESAPTLEKIRLMTQMKTYALVQKQGETVYDAICKIDWACLPSRSRVEISDGRSAFLVKAADRAKPNKPIFWVFVEKLSPRDIPIKTNATLQEIVHAICVPFLGNTYYARLESPERPAIRIESSISSKMAAELKRQATSLAPSRG